MAWAKVLGEINQAVQAQGPIGLDLLRRQKIAAVALLTGRPLILYGTACTTPGKTVPNMLLMIEPGDKVGFDEVTRNVPGPALDVLLHSPGGMADAAAALVALLRQRFNDIRFIVPFYAKSAATMLALAGNEVLMTTAAEIGPIDPQMQVILPNGVQMYSPAYALKEQYERAQGEVNNDPTRFPGWVATLSHPSRLVECELAIKRSTELVEKWLKQWMFAGDPDADKKAKDIAEYLGNHSHFNSHGYPIRLGDPKLAAAKIARTNTVSQAFEDAVWELYCALDHTFTMTGAVKIFENSLTPTDCVVRSIQQVVVQVPQQPPVAPAPGAPTPQAPGKPAVPAPAAPPRPPGTP